jgi:hypothetical protein
VHNDGSDNGGSCSAIALVDIVGQHFCAFTLGSETGSVCGGSAISDTIHERRSVAIHLLPILG